MLKTGAADALLGREVGPAHQVGADLGTLVEAYFGPDGWTLLSMGEQIDTRSASGRLVLNVLTSVAAWEREVIAERTRPPPAQGEARRVHRRQAALWCASMRTASCSPNSEQEVIARARELREQGCRCARSRGNLRRAGTAAEWGHLRAGSGARMTEAE